MGENCKYRIVPSKRPYLSKCPPPVLCFFEVLRVTAHHAKFLCIESVGRSGELTAAIALWMPHQASKVRTHPSVASFTAFFLCSTNFAYCKQRLNAAETWQRGYELVSYVARHSFLHCQAGLDEARSKMRYTLAVYFASGVGPCTGIVEPFKHLLRVTAHPHFLALELRAPMGACSGQYGTNTSPTHFQCTGYLHIQMLIQTSASDSPIIIFNILYLALD